MSHQTPTSKNPEDLHHDPETEARLARAKVGQFPPGSRALITGASSGIGEKMAHLLAGCGLDLILVARRRDRLQALANEIQDFEFHSDAPGQRRKIEIQIISSDLAKPDGVSELMAQLNPEKPVHVLINNAGNGQYGPFLDTPLRSHLDTIQLNLASLTELTYRIAHQMVKTGKPSWICNVGSIASYLQTPNFVSYSAGKHYVRVFSESLREELRGTQIQVSCLCPGGTLTEFSEKNGQKLTRTAESALMTAEEVAIQGLRGLLRGQAIIIPGRLNQFFCLLPRLLPGSWVARIVGATVRQTIQTQPPKPGERLLP
jgi:short-subunit dehydrogenase